MNTEEKKRIYMDLAASTPVLPEVVSAMEPYWQTYSGNPWSRHKEGKEAHTHYSNTQKRVGKLIGASASEIVFTSGASEANTLALRGVLEALKEGGDLAGFRIAVSAIEHPSVGGVIPFAKALGLEVDIIPITNEGIIDVEKLSGCITSKTLLISVMYVNSEIGTIQPLHDIATYIQKQKKQGGYNLTTFGLSAPLFHTDATQAPLWLKIDVKDCGVDCLTLDAHKLYGPKGVGCLYIKKGTPISPLFLGKGGNDEIVRPGTPALPLIMGFARAFEIADEKRDERVSSTQKLKDYFIETLNSHSIPFVINGSQEKSIAGNLNLTFPSLNHDFLQVALDERGITSATRSACLEGRGEGSYVIEALSGSDERNALRFTFDALLHNKDDVVKVVDELSHIIEIQKET